MPESRYQNESGIIGWMASNPIAANLLFEAEETFLAAALSKNPEPVVWSDDTQEGNELADDTKIMLQFHADTLQLRRKLALTVRQWSIYYLGVMKHGWDEDTNDIKTEVRKIQDFVFDRLNPATEMTGPKICSCFIILS